jgi:hypothetical protein
MINVKPEILSALGSNQALLNLLGGPRIYQIKAPDANEFPRITFFELNNVGDSYADDTELTSLIRIQVDVWSKGSTSAIAQEVARTMQSIGYSRDFSMDIFEQDTLVYHKAMRFSTIKEVQ